MSNVVGDKFYLSIEKAEECEECGEINELRPYGKNGANICFKCGMKDIKNTEKMFEQRIKGVKEVIFDIDNLN